MSSTRSSADDLAVLDAWDIGALRSARTPNSGTINRVLLVETASGSYVLRAYRHSDRLPVEREHEVIAYACAHGLPAVAPLPLPGGNTILAHGGRFYGLFPHAAGVQVEHANLSVGQLTAMGAFLARVHQALRGFPKERAVRRTLAIDRAVTLAGIDRLETAIGARRTLEELDRWVLMQLAGRRTWIAQSRLDQLPDLSGLEQQLIHGDYQQTNLFFQGDLVAAIIDWDQSYIAPRAWEVVRTLHLTCQFELEPCRAILAGYRAWAPLDYSELDLAATCYALMRGHDLWQYQAIYFDGNDRVRQFVPRGHFVPLVDRWGALRALLK